MFHSLRSGNVSKKGQQDKFSFTSFPEPSAHETFISMRKQHGSNVYEEQQVLSALQKKYGVTIYKEDNVNFGAEKANQGDNCEDTPSISSSEKIAEYIGWTITIARSCYSCGSKLA